MPYRKAFFLGLLILLLSHLVACKSEPKPVSTDTPAPSPLEVVAQAAKAMLSIESLHFVIERDGALVYIDPAKLLAFKRAEGDFKQPERMRAVLRVITAFTPVDVGMVVLGDEQYATDPITGEWGQMPPEWGQVNLMLLFDPETGLQKLLEDGILNLTLVGTETIEGQPHYRIAGSVNGERMSAMTGGFIGDSDVKLEVWIGTEDYHVRRLRIVEPETDPDDPTTWNLEFSNLGQPVEINAPPVSSSGHAPEHVNSEISWPAPAQWW